MYLNMLYQRMLLTFLFNTIVKRNGQSKVGGGLFLVFRIMGVPLKEHVLSLQLYGEIS